MKKLYEKKCFFFFLAAFFLLCSTGRALADEDFVLHVPAQVSQGEPFYALVITPWPVKNIKVTWLGKTITAQAEYSAKHKGSEALFLLGSTSLTKAGKHPLQVTVTGAKKAATFNKNIILKKKAFKEQHLKVASGLVNLSRKNLERHGKEKKERQKAMAKKTPNRFFEQEFIRPVPGIVTSPYGVRRFFNGEPRRPHFGVDFRGSTGTPVMAVAKGEVVLAANHYFSGNVVYIDHGLGVFSVYAHMSKIFVKTGQHVEAGEKIGEVGATGRVTGPHLHFGLKVLGQYVDPLSLFPEAEPAK